MDSMEKFAKSSGPADLHTVAPSGTYVTSFMLGIKFDVVLMDPPWEEFVRRAPGRAKESPGLGKRSRTSRPTWSLNTLLLLQAH
ncbi:hypothetical protein ABBQ32_002327 [Trebouxia sp. C0010 RCD-2024]